MAKKHEALTPAEPREACPPLPAVDPPASPPGEVTEAPNSNTPATYALVPVAEVDGFISKHVETKLSLRQARGLRMLAAGLDRAGACLEDGRRVVRPPDAIRWLLEQIHAGRLYVAGIGLDAERKTRLSEFPDLVKVNP